MPVFIALAALALVMIAAGLYRFWKDKTRLRWLGVAAFAAVILGTVITSLSWLILAFHPTVWGAGFSLFFLAIGEIIQAPRYYEYISRLAPAEQQGTYMGFAFVPIGIGSLIGGPFGGFLLHHFGEVQHQPAMIWFWITGIGLATAGGLWMYDRFVRRDKTVTS